MWHRSRINKESTTQYVYFFFGLFFAIISTFSSLASSNLLHIRTTFAYSHSSVVRFVSPNYSRSRLSCRVLVSFVSGIRQIFHSEFAFRKFVLCRLGWFVLLYAKCFFAWFVGCLHFFFASSKTPSISACVIRIYAVSWIIRWRIHCVFRFQGAHKWHRQQNIKPCNSQCKWNAKAKRQQ